MDQNSKSLWILAFVLALYTTQAFPADLRGNTFSLIAGIKDLESRNWPPYGEQSELGIELVFRNERFPFALVLEYLSANAEFDYFGKEQSRSSEFNLGVRYEVESSSKIAPYIEAGITYAKGKVDLQGSNVDANDIFNESAHGAWFAAGNTWRSRNNMDWGFKIKKTVANADLPSGRSVDLGGIHYLLTMGFDY